MPHGKIIVTDHSPTQTEALLARLVAFDVTSADSNLGLIDWVEHYLRSLGFAVHLVPDEGGQKAGLYASIGPRRPGGVLLSAHSDVVPAEGQTWTRPPFDLTRDGTRLYGRGTTDMKGFLASVLAAADAASRANLSEPFKIALSYDEEVGCLGIARMIGQLEATIGLPRLVIVGEPTQMQVAVGHKGKVAWRMTAKGQAGHSSLAPRYRNALFPMAEFLLALHEEQAVLAKSGVRDPDYDIPHATLHPGVARGGRVLNVVPEEATVDFELRYLPGDDPAGIEARIAARAAAIAARASDERALRIERTIAYPGFAIAADDPVVAEVQAWAGGTATTRVGFGTEAGFFAGMGVPVVVCGPGAIGQAHTADEYIEATELAACDAMLARLVQSLAG
jgi:acetylornithine deacetylase